MRKNLFLAALFSFVIIPTAFGAGIGVAEIRLRFLAPKKVVLNVALNQKDREILEKADKIESNTIPPANPLEPVVAEEESAVSVNESEKAGEDAKVDQNNDKVLKFALIGDSQYFKPGNASGALQEAVGNIKNQNVDLVMAMGDLVSSCDGGAQCEEKYASWKNVLGPLASKTYPVQGNHDRTGGERADAAWQKSFSLPTNGPAGFSELAYSFDVQNSHFVVLASEKPKEHVINSVQREWLERDLAARKKGSIFVFFHEPAYPVGSKIGESLDADPKERNALWEILSRHRVTAVFSGHEHIASRKKIGNVYQFVFGNTESFDHSAPKAGMAEWSYVGQNFGIVEVSGKKITVKTYSVDGKEVNSFPFSI